LAVCVVATVVALAVGYLAGPVHEHSTKKIIRRYVVEHLRGAQTPRCEVELRSSCLWINQDNVERHHKWGDVIAVHDTDAGVEIVTKTTMVAVRNRAFLDQAKREAFIAQARRLSSLAVGKT
jgi:hypothetical protein